MIRNHLKGDKMTSKSGFRYRGVSSSRLEALTDAVFGFSITLLVVSLEVPATYSELQASMYGFLGFVFATVIIFIFWNDHYEFFLRYGLEDTKTKILNFLFLFLILFYIYPLKFLFNLLGTAIVLQIKSAFGDTSATFKAKVDEFNGAMLNETQWFELFFYYALGLILIYFVFFFFYRNALKYKNELELNDLEIFETKTKLFSYPVMMIVPFVSILILFFAPTEYKGFAGAVYCLFGVVIPIYSKIRDKKMIKLGLGQKK